VIPQKNAGLSKKVRVRHLADLDRRTLATQRVLRLTDAFMSDMGGDDHVAAGELELVHRAAVLTAWAW
jgi:hypothetical protein